MGYDEGPVRLERTITINAFKGDEETVEGIWFSWEQLERYIGKAVSMGSRAPDFRGDIVAVGDWARNEVQRFMQDLKKDMGKS